MSRPPRGDRLTARGRPKRRAAAKANIFKYQLATDPSRVEENDLRRALQESLEEQSHTVKHNGVIKPPQPKRARLSGNIHHQIITASSSTGSLVASSSVRDKDRVPPSLASTSASSPSGKRTRFSAGTISNGAHQQNSNNNKCDANPSSLITLDSSPISATSNRAIRTYSRSSQQLNSSIDTDSKMKNNTKSQAPQSCLKSSTSPTTTIVCKAKSVTPDSRTPNGNELLTNKGSLTNQSSVSRSTQTPACNATTATTPVIIDNCKFRVSTITPNKSPATRNSPHTKDNGTAIATTNGVELPPVQNQYLKSKRESKNDAYAKMTALKVSTEKFPSSNPKSSNIKKTSPKGVLNNSSANKDSLKATQQRARDNSNGSSTNTSLNVTDSTEHCNNEAKTSHKQDGKSAFKRDTTPSKKSTAVVSPNGLIIHDVVVIDNGNQATGVIGKQMASSKINLDESGIEYDCSPIGTNLDLSNDRDQSSQTSVNTIQKRNPGGSWSLLGVPEEKVIYTRDDEPPRRLICYPAIKHVEGDVIQVKDSVLLRSGARKTDLPYIAKVCAFWEDAETGGVMMSLFWYYRPEHTEDGRKPHHLVDEIFASRHRDVDTVECIEDKCYVLTFNEYCRYRKRCKMEQANTTWSLTDVTIPMSNESYPRRNRIPDSDVNPELVFCCRQVYDSRMKRLLKNPLINPKYGHI